MNYQSFMPTLIENALDAFKQSLSTFVENLDSSSENSLTAELISDFGAALDDASGAACRKALKDFIEAHDTCEEVIHKDGKPYKFKKVISKTFLTRFGEIQINRRCYYHWRGGPGLFPLDEKIDMQGRFVMPDIVEFLLYGVAKLIPSDLAEMFTKINHFKPSAPLIQDIVNQDGQGFHNFLNSNNRAASIRTITPPAEAPTAMVASMDGANLHVREPGKKKGAKTKRPGKNTGAAEKEEKSSSYKNAMIGTISYYNTAEVIDFNTQEKVIEPSRINTTYIGRMPEERFQTFKNEFESLVGDAEAELPEGAKKILLMDGALGLWGYVDANPDFDDYIKLVDFFHAAEHLSTLAEALFGKGSTEAQKWYERWLSKIKHEPGAVPSMIRSANRYRRENYLKGDRLKVMEKELTFFIRNQDRMGYSELVDQGLPIGSGPVEAACKTIVKARFCQSGMRWSIQGGQNVMNLRVIQKSNQWDETWEAYKEAGGYQAHCQNAA